MTFFFASVQKINCVFSVRQKIISTFQILQLNRHGYLVVFLERKKCWLYYLHVR